MNDVMFLGFYYMHYTCDKTWLRVQDADLSPLHLNIGQMRFMHKNVCDEYLYIPLWIFMIFMYFINCGTSYNLQGTNNTSFNPVQYYAETSSVWKRFSLLTMLDGGKENGGM